MPASLFKTANPIFPAGGKDSGRACWHDEKWRRRHFSKCLPADILDWNPPGESCKAAFNLISAVKPVRNVPDRCQSESTKARPQEQENGFKTQISACRCDGVKWANMVTFQNGRRRPFCAQSVKPVICYVFFLKKLLHYLIKTGIYKISSRPKSATDTDFGRLDNVFF